MYQNSTVSAVVGMSVQCSANASECEFQSKYGACPPFPTRGGWLAAQPAASSAATSDLMMAILQWYAGCGGGRDGVGWRGRG